MNSKISSEAALLKLTEGNARYCNGDSIHQDISVARMKQTTHSGQSPFATIIGCSDSRCPVEHIFDVGIGDVFVVRVAGNVCATNETATAEFGVHVLGTPLLVVLGHTNCGAISVAVAGKRPPGSIHKLIDQVMPSVQQARKLAPQSPDADIVTLAVEQNINATIRNLLDSPLIAQAVQTKSLLLIGGIYDMATGKVNWLKE